MENTQTLKRIKEMPVCGMQNYPCANCPMLRRAKAKPRSISARIHRWHASWYPGWKAFQAAQRAYKEQLRAASI